VLTRYLFNSPTNWAHESMFLMFGMQYVMAAGFTHREHAYVRFISILPPPYEGRCKRVDFDLLFYFLYCTILDRLGVCGGFSCRVGGVLYQVGHSVLAGKVNIVGEGASC